MCWLGTQPPTRPVGPPAGSVTDDIRHPAKQYWSVRPASNKWTKNFDERQNHGRIFHNRGEGGVNVTWTVWRNEIFFFAVYTTAVTTLFSGLDNPNIFKIINLISR